MYAGIIRWLKRAAGAGVLAAAVAAGVVWFGDRRPGHEAKAEPAPRAPEAVAVTAEPVTLRPVRRSVDVVGSLFGRDEVALTPKVEGRVLRVCHDVGDVVRPGDVLLEIDPTDYQLAVAEARRALDLELARLGLKEPPTRDFDVRALPSVARAAALEKNAASRCERLRRLGGGGAASAEDLEQAETDLAVARANYGQAVIDAEATLAAVRQKQAALDTATQRLRDTRVVAPAPGGAPPEPTPAEYVVSQRSVSEGEIVRAMPGATTTLFRLVIDRPLKLQAQVPECHAAEVRVGQAAELEAECCPGEHFAGTVARINPAVDRASRTFLVEVHVPNADRRLRAGGFARARILTRIEPQARTVPEEALVRFAGVTKVFVVEKGQARAVPVAAGASGTDGGRAWVEVAGELPTAARVVTSGQSQLADGTATRLKDARGTSAHGDKAP